LGITESVRFLGSVPEEDLPTLYSGATLFVFPSLWEGFGLPVLEAMACGVPAACSKTSSLPEIVGDAALMFDPLDVEEMAATIGRALEDEALRAELSEEGLQRAAQFSWEDTATATLKVYSALIPICNPCLFSISDRIYRYISPRFAVGGGDFSTFQTRAYLLEIEAGVFGHPLWVILSHPFTPITIRSVA
jgi:hypothetical protein